MLQRSRPAGPGCSTGLTKAGSGARTVGLGGSACQLAGSGGEKSDQGEFASELGPFEDRLGGVPIQCQPSVLVGRACKALPGQPAAGAYGLRTCRNRAPARRAPEQKLEPWQRAMHMFVMCCTIGSVNRATQTMPPSS